MKENIKTLKSLLKFYQDKEVEIEMMVSYKGGTVVSGNVIAMSCIFNPWIELKSKTGASMKIFLKDIEEDSVIPTEFAKKENKKENKQFNRSPIPDKLRFDVFRRDKHVCQYCGANGPNVELEIDHKIPVARGGTDDIDNLKTSCYRCNRGKGDRV